MSNVAIAAPDQTKARDFSPFSCRRFDTVGTVRVAVEGELHMATVPELEGMLRDARADPYMSAGLAGSDCAFPRVTRCLPLLLGGGSPTSTARTVTNQSSEPQTKS